MPHTSPSFSRLSAEQIVRVNDLCEKFEARWQAGARPCLEGYLVPEDAPEYLPLLEELILLDVEYRRKAGEVPGVEDYAKRFPRLDAVRLGELLRQTSRVEVTPG